MFHRILGVGAILIGLGVVKLGFKIYQGRVKDSKPIKKHPYIHWKSRPNEEIVIRDYEASDDKDLCILGSLCIQDGMYAVYVDNDWSYKARCFYSPWSISLAVSRTSKGSEPDRVIGVSALTCMDVLVKSSKGRYKERIGYAFNFRTHPSYRGRQINFRLTRKCLQDLGTHGVRIWSSLVIVDNTKSLSAIAKFLPKNQSVIHSSIWDYWTIILFRKLDLGLPKGLKIVEADATKANELLVESISAKFDMYSSDTASIFASSAWKGSWFIDDAFSGSFAVIHLYESPIRWTYETLKLPLWLKAKLGNWIFGSDRIPSSPGDDWITSFTFGHDCKGPKGRSLLKCLFRKVNNVAIDNKNHLVSVPWEIHSSLTVAELLPRPRTVTTTAGISLYENPYHYQSSSTRVEPKSNSLLLSELQKCLVWHDPRLA